MLHPPDASNDSWGPKGRAVSWRTGRKFACHALRKHWPSQYVLRMTEFGKLMHGSNNCLVNFTFFGLRILQWKCWVAPGYFLSQGRAFALELGCWEGHHASDKTCPVGEIIPWTLWGDDGLPRVDDQMSTKLKVRALALFLLWRWLKIFQHFYYLEGFESDFSFTDAVL